MAVDTQPHPESTSRLPFAFAIGLTFSALVRLGAFSYPDTGLVAAGLVLCAWASRKPAGDSRVLWLVIPFVAVWVGADFARGSVDRSLALAGGVAALAAGIVVARGARQVVPDRWLLAVAGTVNAVSVGGWLLRREPLALVFDDRYRLAGTVAYPNAAGLFAALSLVLALAMRGNARLRSVSVFLASTALLGSLSRGAIVGAAVGVGLSWRSISRRDVAPFVLGAAVASAGVVTSASSSKQVFLLAGVAVLAAALALVAPRESRRSQVRFAGRAVAAVAAAIVLLALPRAGQVAQSRFDSASTEDRTAEWTAAFDAGMRHPLTGDGPERDLVIHNFRGFAVARYAHDEFLQVFAGAGIVGLGALAVAMAAIGWSLWERRPLAPGTVGIAAVIVIGALVDFPWHFVALMAFAGLCLGRQHPLALADG